MTPPFAPDPATKIGTIFEVGGSKFKAALASNLDELTRLHRGRVYGIGRIGSLVKIHVGRRLLFASISALRLQTEEEAAAVAALQAERRILEADLVGEGLWNLSEARLEFSRGLSGSALPMQEVHLLTDEEVKHVYGAVQATSDDRKQERIAIGNYSGSPPVECLADIDRMFSQHCAILGSTGTGKSSTVAAIIRAVLEHDDGSLRPRIVLIDPHGEYGRAFADRAVVYRAYDALGLGDIGGKDLRLPYWLMSSDEFRSLVVGKTEFEATSQANTVYKALAHARMVAAGLIEPAKEWRDTPGSASSRHPEEPRALDPAKDSAISSFDRDRPVPFSLNEFRRHIELEQCLRVQKGAWTRVSDSDWYGDYASILNKLRVLESDPRIRFLMKSHEADDPDLASILSQFVGATEGQRDLRIVDISGLPNEVAGPLTAAIARLLFQYKLHQTETERHKDPLLLVCEEAHRYVPNQGEAQYAAAQTAIRRIAREGRKYGLGLMLVSQRPSDVEATVLAQCNTWLVLRLTNAADQSHVTRMLPDALGGMATMLSSLPRQEALFVGEGAALPARIRLRTLKKGEIPRSEDISFGKGWRTPPPNAGDLAILAKRMIGSS